MDISPIVELPSVSLSERRSLPACQGVYFAVVDTAEVAYVGATWSFAQRWRSHSKIKDLIGLGSVRIHYLLIDDDETPSTFVEQDVIEAFRPRLNLVPARWGLRPDPGEWLPKALARKPPAPPDPA